MNLYDEVKRICDRLAPYGWKNLLLQHGLDITKDNLGKELLKELTINRELDGFEDFALEGKRGIEPGMPYRSLLFHALASPNVIKGPDGEDLGAFPTLGEIETIENYVYGVQHLSVQDLRRRATEIHSWINGQNSHDSEEVPMAIVVFASEYRPAPETVHQKHADMCFSRTGVARVGTHEPLYDDHRRGFLPFVNNEIYAFRALPARYSAYIAVQLTGDQRIFGPLRFELPDKQNGNRKFWVPIHKIFSGKECIRDLDLQVTLKVHHMNEKIRRVHLHLQKIRNYPQIDDATLNKDPYTFTDGIAEFSANPKFGHGILVPVPHNPLVEAVEYNDEKLTFLVPSKNMQLLEDNTQVFAYFDSSLWLTRGSSENLDSAGNAPEYVHVRHKIEDGTVKNLNDTDDVKAEIEKEYRALHYVDFTGDGWIEVSCPELESNNAIPDSLRVIPAYSLVTAPDFFINTDQGELMVWYINKLEKELQNPRWFNLDSESNLLETLSDQRYPPNLELKSVKGDIFSPEDDTATAIVSMPLKELRKETKLFVPKTMRHTYLPDAASGVFAPGWDIGLDDTGEHEHLASYTLGSPFPEDSKLCAALSSFWPAVAPDAGRTFWWKEIPSRGRRKLKGVYPTVSPLTDEEIGSSDNIGWDGFRGPRKITNNGQKEILEYYVSEYIDYVESALQRKFSLRLTSNVDIEEYKDRIKAMARTYHACKITDQYLNPVFSFRKAEPTDTELIEAENQADSKLSGRIFRIELGNGQYKSNRNNKKIEFEISNKYTCFVGTRNIVLVNRNNDKWKPISTP